jgi:outer membrane receptor for ferrienterochelin and colicins
LSSGLNNKNNNFFVKLLMNRVFIYLLISFSINIFSNAQDNLSIVGLVLNEINEPIRNANVLLEGMEGGTASNSVGEFVFKNLNEDTYTIVVSFVGYETIKKEILINKNNNPLNLIFYLNKKEIEIDNIVVTGTRTQKRFSDSPVRTELIPAKEIEQSGSTRLNDILLEQSGLAVTNDHGQGIQMQGLDPDYTLIMIDGEPLIGRTTGTLELSRFTLTNLKQIEIVKGPSSSLYGSEALAGVINLITNTSDVPLGFDFQSIYKTNNTIDLFGNTVFNFDDLHVTLSANSLSSDGYDLTPNSLSQTSPALSALTISPKIIYSFNESTSLKLNSRFYFEEYDNVAVLSLDDGTHNLNDEGKLTDWNSTLSFDHKFSSAVKTQLKLYATRYLTDSKLSYQEDNSIYDHSKFDQYVYRTELFNDFILNDQHYIVAGGGYLRESVEADRIYDDDKISNSFFVFSQEEWIPNDVFDVVAGARFDWHSEYASRLSPKLSALVKPLSFLKIRASFGSGFKAPTLQQLYLNFSNPQVGYSVFGSSNIKESFTQLEESGQIERILIDPESIEEISAENSVAYNIGFEITPMDYISASINLFRNNVNDLIEASPIAFKTNGQSVFTYFNLNKIYTQGIESEATVKFSNDLSFSVSYQYLEAYDEEVLEMIRNGKISKVGTNGVVRPVHESEYGGLYNRSRHSCTIKLFYENNKLGFSANLRGVVRGKYGFGDVNSNGILDDKREYVPGYAIWNATASKDIGEYFTVLLGIENIFDKTNSQFIPSLPGRIIYGGIRLKFYKQSNE